MTEDAPLAGPPPNAITLLLQRAADGDRAALDEVFASLYPDLKRLARARLWQQGRGDDISTTMLVHESFMRLSAARALRLEDRRHFFAYAAKVMRNVIIDTARQQLAERRGGAVQHVTLSAADDAPQDASGEELVRVNDALRDLEALDPDLAELVEMRYFGGYGELEIAQLLGIHERTVRRRWDKARAWLYVAVGTR